MEAKYLNSSGETTASGGSTLCKWHPRGEVGFINIVKPWELHSSSPYRSSPYRLSAQWREQDFDRNRDFFFENQIFRHQNFFPRLNFPTLILKLVSETNTETFFLRPNFPKGRESKKRRFSRPRLRLSNIFEIFWRGTQPSTFFLMSRPR